MNRSKWAAGVLIVAFLALATLLVTMPAWADLITITHTTLEDFNAGFLYHTGLTRFDDGEVQLIVVGLAGDWITDTNTTGLPALARHTAVYTDEHIIVLGGRDINSLVSNGVYHSTVDLYSHDLADWQATTPLPASAYPNGGVYWHASVIVHDRVYVLGGRDNSANTYDTVSFAPINADGSVGAWQTTTPLPEGLHLLKAVKLNGRIYVIGGQTSGMASRDTVYIGEPDPVTGQIGAWTPTTSFVHPTFAHMVAAHEDKIYVMGGFHPGLPPGYVAPYTHFATVNPATGQVGSWTQLTNMEHNLFGGEGLAFSGVLYTTGGAINNLTSPSDYVGTNLVNPDGTVGAWSNTSAIVPARFYHATVRSSDGWLYLINGSDGTGPLANINRGATSGVGQQHAPDGTYTSSVIDFGSTNRLRNLEWNTTITDTSLMTITMEYQTKLAFNNPWSPWRGPYPSSPVPGTVTTTLTIAGNARFYQYRAYLATNDTQKTPSLNAVRLVYETPTYEVRIGKDAEPAPGSTLFPGDVISYTLTYSNGLGGITATNTFILDAPPLYTSYIPGSIFGPGADASDPEQLFWDLGSLPPESSGQVGYSVLVSPTLYYDTVLENTASIDSDQGPIRYSNVVTHAVDVPYEIQVAKDAVPPPNTFVEPGSRITYTVRLTNTGDIAVNDVVLIDTYDVSEDYTVLATNPAPDLGTDNVWSFGTLAISETRQVEIVVELEEVLPNNWPVTNQADVLSLQGPGAQSAVVTHTTQYPPGTQLTDLVITDVRVEPASPTAGSPVDFYVTIGNQGPLDAADSFWLEIYIKPQPSDPPEWPSDHDQGYCLNNCTVLRADFVQAIASLPQGSSFEVQFQGDQLVFPSDGAYDVYALIDVAFNLPEHNPYWGRYAEWEESNNWWHETVVITGGSPRIYLPIVRKNSN